MDDTYMKHLLMFGNAQKNKASNKGFVLVETMISVVIMSIVLLIVFQFSEYTYLWNSKIRSDIAVMGDGRYTRRIIGGRIKWSVGSTKITDQGTIANVTSGVSRWDWAVKGKGAYRIMSNGALQPISGSRVQDSTDKRMIEHTGAPPFIMNEDGVIHMSWGVSNRIHDGSTLFLPGQGGLSMYEVCQSIYSDYEWYKSK